MEVDAHIKLGLRAAKGGEVAESITNTKALNCLRIATMSITEAADPTPREQRTSGRLDGPGYCWPLLVWFDDSLKTIKFTKTHAFEFDDFCIGDINENDKWNQQKYTSNASYKGLFNFCQREGWGIAKFKKLLRQHLAEVWGNQRMPFLPTYCFHKFDPAEHGLGLSKWPKKGIDVAVRCVNQYDKLKNVAFRRDIRLVIMPEDTMDDIREFVDEEINTMETEDGVKINSARIFEDQHRDEREWQFWVMPQTGPKKLYRFDEGKISRFLSEANEIRPRDKKVYMEAHVMPKNP